MMDDLLVKAAIVTLQSVAQVGETMEDVWTQALWGSSRKNKKGITVYPYCDPVDAGSPVIAISREDRVRIMKERGDLGMKIWHPQDKRWPTDEFSRREIGIAERFMDFGKKVLSKN